jgi:hypothetical protein
MVDKALCQQVTISGFGEPNKNDLRFLQTWLNTAKGYNLFLTGEDRSVWDKGDDLIALQPRKQSDIFSEWLTNRFIYWFYRKFVFNVNWPALELQVIWQMGYLCT